MQLCNDFAMKCSVITVCKNESDRIKRTCESVIHQSYKDFEWIVLDGGSTDGTVEILASYSSYMLSFESNPDEGIYWAMNKGIALARGEYLLFLNGGDCLYSEDSLAAIFRTDPHYDLIVGNQWDPVAGAPSRVPDVINMRTFVIYGLPHQCTFIRRNLFVELGDYDVNFRIAADWEFFCRALLREGLTISRSPCIVSVFYPGGISGRNTRETTREIDVLFRRNLSLMR